MLDLITAHRWNIVSRAQTMTAARGQGTHGEGALSRHVSLFLSQFGGVLRLATVGPGRLDEAAAACGRDLFRLGFTASQVVHAYGDIGRAVTELAVEHRRVIAMHEFGVLNRCLDEALAIALVEYEQQRDSAILRGGRERVRLLSRDADAAVSAALCAFTVLKGGAAGPNSATGAELQKSLLLLQSLIDRSVSEVRVAASVVRLQAPQRQVTGPAVEELQP